MVKLITYWARYTVGDMKIILTFERDKLNTFIS